MNWIKVAKSLEGIHTAKTISSELGIGRQTAINYIHALKKKGFLKTGRIGYSRLYTIRPYHFKEIGYEGLYETINRLSPIKLVIPYNHRIVGHKMPPEEAIVRAVLEKEYRLILASMFLFTKIMDWKNMYTLSKENKIERQIGALCDLASRLFKVDADKRVLEKMRESKPGKTFIIENVKSDDFKDIEEKWGVYIPFNAADFERYKAGD